MTPAQARAWLASLPEGCSPDVNAYDLIDTRTGRPTFTRDEADEVERRMDEACEVVEAYGVLIDAFHARRGMVGGGSEYVPGPAWVCAAVAVGAEVVEAGEYGFWSVRLGDRWASDQVGPVMIGDVVCNEDLELRDVPDPVRDVPAFLLAGLE